MDKMMEYYPAAKNEHQLPTSPWITLRHWIKKFHSNTYCIICKIIKNKYIVFKVEFPKSTLKEGQLGLYFEKSKLFVVHNT